MNQMLTQLQARVLALFPLTEERNSFFQNLSILVESGTPLVEALRVVQGEVRSGRMKRAVAEILVSVENGERFWMALDRHRFVFSEYEIRLTKIAEETGRLAKSLGYLANQLGKDLELRAKIRSALFYPLLVLVFAAAIGLGITWFVLPRLSRVFTSLHIALPFATRALITVGDIVGRYGQWIFAGLLVAGIAAFFILRFTRVRFVALYALELIPGIGPFLRDVQTAKISLFFGTLLESGVPVVEALETLHDISEGGRERKFFAALRERVGVGESFEKSFGAIKEAKTLFPSLTQYMIFTGEKSGNLPGAFLYIAEFYDKKLDAASKNLAQVLEPLLLVGIALVVAFIAIAIVTPIYGLVSNFGAPQQGPPPVVETAPPPAPVSEPPAAQPPVSVPEPVPAALLAPVTEKRVMVLSSPLGYVNVRSGPGTDYKKLREAKPGEEYAYTAAENGWYRIVDAEGVAGWISATYVKVSE